MSLKRTDKKTVNDKVIMFIIDMIIRIVKFSVLNNTLVKIVSLNIKRYIRFKFRWVRYHVKPLIILRLGGIMDTGIPLYI